MLLPNKRDGSLRIKKRRETRETEYTMYHKRCIGLRVTKPKTNGLHRTQNQDPNVNFPNVTSRGRKRVTKEPTSNFIVCHWYHQKKNQ